ncbi:hypothetical protein V2J09_000837 [Rumex salicifolius]
MQRQSLGSPSSKLHGHGRLTAVESPAASPSSSTPSVPPVNVPRLGAVDDDELKLDKVNRRRSLSPPFLPVTPEKLIHFVPIITLLCFLVLFLFSHEPTPTDLADFNGFKNPMKLSDSREIDDFERVLEKGETLANRSLRNLKEFRNEGNRKSNSHRKLADF